MTNAETTSRIEMRWVPVTSTDGRTRMEAVWVEVAPTTAQHAVHHAA